VYETSATKQACSPSARTSRRSPARSCRQRRAVLDHDRLAELRRALLVTVRAMMSVPLPGVKGTMIRDRLDGQACACAPARARAQGERCDRSAQPYGHSCLPEERSRP